MKTFLLSFQESLDQLDDASGIVAGTSTKTATREEDDQDPSFYSSSTRTATGTREEDDQDAPFSNATKTLTETREEDDADPSSLGYFAIPRQLSCQFNQPISAS